MAVLPAARVPAVPLVDRVQALIEELYDVAVPLRTQDFLVDEALRRTLPGAQLHLPEQLFVRGASGPAPGPGPGTDQVARDDDEDDAVEVALYVDADVLQLLRHDDPFVRLHAGNLEAFCVLAEGVSHFVYLAWRLGGGLDVSALELELQAELDKFCAGLLLLGPERSAALGPEALWRQLFLHYELHPGLSGEESQRYHTASRAAGRMARSLLGPPGSPPRREVVLRRARNWCRLPLADKLRGVGRVV